MQETLLTDVEVGNMIGGVTRTTVWNHVKTGFLPKPIKLGGLSRWPISDIISVIEKAKASPERQPSDISFPAASLFPIDTAPKDGSVIIVISSDASTVECVRYGLPPNLDPEEYGPCWYTSDWSEYLDDPGLDMYLGWIKPPEEVVWLTTQYPERVSR